MSFLKTTIRSITSTVILTAAITTVGCRQPIKPAIEKAALSTLQIELYAIDSSMENCYLKANADSLVGFYDTAFIYLPEYKQPVNKTEVLRKFYEEVNILSEKLRAEIGEFDKGVVKAVLTGDGEARANEFTIDGIYMPHFDSMQVGMGKLRPYMLRTYTHSSITYVKDTFHEIFDTGDFVFLSGHFEVGFGQAGNKGSFEGNMSNLMKRSQDGKLLMYRQLAHN